jgi:hypothetical protein
MRRTRFDRSGFLIFSLLLAVLILPVGITCAQDAPSPDSGGLSLPGIGADSKIKITVLGDGYVDIDEETNTAYTSSRARITYGDANLEADQMQLNMNTLSAQAAGNVVLTYGDGKITADRLDYDFNMQKGKAFGIAGKYGPLRVLEAESKDDLPNFERTSESEILFRNAKLTTCDLPKPHYYLKVREVLVYPGDRIFVRGATLYVRGVPVFYLPFYSRGLGEGSPWMVRAGFKSGLGAWARVGYTYRHSVEEPSLEDDGEMQLRDDGALTLYVDYFMSRGPGAGINYDYSFNYGRHHGEMDLYGMADSGRPIDEDDDEKRNDRDIADEDDGDEESSGGRYYIGLEHRSQITDNLAWTAQSDWVSDPELFDEVLDLFQEFERRRMMERSAKTALTYTRESFVARIMFDLRDQISRDRIRNFADPGDVNRDYDEEPNERIEDRNDQAINTDRWGHTSIRAPQLTFETNWLKLWDTPLYYHTDLNIFNSLDRGLNIVDPVDDAWVHGFDWYQSLMWRWRIAKRTTLLTKAGVGFGMASRSSDDWNYGDDTMSEFGVQNPAYPLSLGDAYGGVTMMSDNEVYIGRNGRLLAGENPDSELVFSPDDIDAGFAYADIQSHLRHRFSTPLTMDLIYTYRFATEDNIADWYYRMGNRFVRNDIYNFRMREHSIRGALTYRFAQPDLTLRLNAFQNLIAAGERYPYEPVTDLSLSGDWASENQAWNIGSGIGFGRTQIYNPADPLAYVDSSFRLYLRGRYNDPSGKWWAQAGTTFQEELDEYANNDQIERYHEADDNITANALVGAYIGSKWKAQVGANFKSEVSGLSDVTLNLERDLHDALLLFMLSFENSVYSDDPDDSVGDDGNGDGGVLGQLNFQLGLQPKLPSNEAIPGMPGLSIGDTNRKQPAVSSSDFEF